MAGVTRGKRRRRAASAAHGQQLLLPFEQPAKSPDRPHKKERELVHAPTAEILPPVKAPMVDPGSKRVELDQAALREQQGEDNRTPGQKENEYLLGRAEKYEDRAFWAMVMFMVASVLTLLVKAGLPLSQALLERLGLPLLSDTRLVAGMLSCATMVLALVTCYSALRTRQHRAQAELTMIRWSFTGFLADVLFRLFAILFGLLLVTTIYLTYWDVTYLAKYLYDHIVYPLDGWEPLDPPS